MVKGRESPREASQQGRECQPPMPMPPPDSPLLWGGSPLLRILQGPPHLCLSPVPIPPRFPGTCSTSGVFLPVRRLYLLWSLSLFPPDSHLPAGLHPQLPSSRVALRSPGAISRKLPESHSSQTHLRLAMTPPSANLATPHSCPSSPSLGESLSSHKTGTETKRSS